MRITNVLILISGILFVCPRSSGQEEEIPRAQPVQPVFGDAVTSESGQFRVRGGDGALRGSVALLAEQTRDEFLRLTEEMHAESMVPVHISLVGQQGDATPMRTTAKTITYNEGDYTIRLSVHTGRGLDVERFQHAVTSALVYERSLAKRTTEDADTPLLVQPWLIEGLREANRWRLGTTDRRLYEALFRSGGLFKIDDLFTMTGEAHDALDAATRAAFHVSSGALVMALLEQPDGIKAFREFLNDVALFAGEMPTLLRRHFPDLNLSENSMAKWWTLQLANKGAARLSESLSIFETEAALDDALRLRFRDEDGVMRDATINAWPELTELDKAERTAATRMAGDALVRLSYRSFPSYRPLLRSYQEVLNMIARETTRPEAIVLQLEELAATRLTMITKSERARDYMDWFEITRARETSGAFDDYLRLKQQLRDRPRSNREDPVSDTLDRFDIIFHRGSNNHPNWHVGGWQNQTHLPRR